MRDQPSETDFCKPMQTGGEDESAFDIVNWVRAELTFTICSSSLLARVGHRRWCCCAMKAVDPVSLRATVFDSL